MAFALSQHFLSGLKVDQKPVLLWTLSMAMIWFLHGQEEHES